MKKSARNKRHGEEKQRQDEKLSILFCSWKVALLHVVTRTSAESTDHVGVQSCCEYVSHISLTSETDENNDENLSMKFTTTPKKKGTKEQHTANVGSICFVTA